MMMMLLLMMMMMMSGGEMWRACGCVRSCVASCAGGAKRKQEPHFGCGENIPKRFRQDKTVPRCPKVLWNQKTVPKDLWAPRSKPAVVEPAAAADS